MVQQNREARYARGSWKDVDAGAAQNALEQQIISTGRLTAVRCLYRPGADFPPHLHPQEQITIVEEGTLCFRIDEEEVEIGAGEMISIPERVRHGSRALGAVPARALNLFLADVPGVRHEAFGLHHAAVPGATCGAPQFPGAEQPARYRRK